MSGGDHGMSLAAHDVDGEGRARYRLELFGGAQGGARAHVADDAPTTLGSALECDVVLSDPRVAERALTFVPGAEGLSVEVHADGVSRDGVPLESGTHRLVGGETLALGDTRLVLAENGSVDGGAGRDGDEFDPDAALAEAERRRGNDDEGGETFSPLVAILGVAILFGCVAVGVSYWLHRSAAPEPTPASAAAPATLELPRLLDENGFDDVAYVSGAGAGARLTGHVASRGRLLELQRIVRGAMPRARVDVHVQDEIVRGVEDFYRTHGIEAAVESGGAGVVKVVTRTAEEARLAGIEAKAMGDVAGLSLLQARNEPPEEAPAAAPPLVASPAAVEDEGKRVVAVVSGAPSYVLTADDSRYFVGASLPTGHRIVAIGDDSVVLDWQGEETRLEF